jgi:hypothetical protein
MEDAVRQAISAAGELPAGGLKELANALLVRVAWTLAGTDDQATQFLSDWRGHNAGELLQQFPPAPLVSQAQADSFMGQVDPLLNHLEDSTVDPEAIHNAFYLENMAEETPYHVRDLRAALLQIADLPEGQSRLERFITAMLANPYPRYRDIGLVEFGVVSASVSPNQDPWLRKLLRRILQAGLDREGVTFTFDLPFMLLEAARRRHLSSEQQGSLPHYCDTAWWHSDRWGTSVRGRSAKASALYWHGDRQGAVNELKEAQNQRTGFAGFAVMHYLALANRWHEFQQATITLNSTQERQQLIQKAEEQAHYVRDESFRHDRVQLVQQYRRWDSEVVPSADAIEGILKQMPDADKRLAFIDHISARLAGMTQPDLDSLKALVPLALLDGTTLDAVLGRLYGWYLSNSSFTVDNDDLAKLIHLCQDSLMTGMPWALKPVPESGVYLRPDR